MFSVRRPTTADLARVVADQATSKLTYADHGATLGSRPAGYRHDQWNADLGSYDESAFDRLGAAIVDWQVQRAAGLTIYPADPVRPGLTFALSFRLSGVYVVAAGRVVYLTREPGRRGFAYGTLPQHPEEGEEAFHVVRDGSRMMLQITAFSRPRHPLARAGAPVTRLVQVRMNNAYLQSMRAVARSLR
jgi:uncharacterized protein (UPF0548 family)